MTSPTSLSDFTATTLSGEGRDLSAYAGDVVLVLGKGHETGQIIGSDVYPFDDAEQASVAVAALDGKI